MDRMRLSAITWILAAVSGLLGLGTPAIAQVPAAERAALIAIYSAANGPEWATRTNWRDAGDTDFGAAGTECTWFGVTCTGGTVTQLSLQANQLRGTLPAALLDLTGLSDSASDLRWNAIQTSDATLLSFLNSKQVGGDWQSTQTVAVTGLALPSGRPAPTSIPLSWTPIAYTGDGGGYRISTSTTAGGPYTTWGTTAAKTDTSVTVTGLNVNTTYYFVIESVTNPHAGNANTVVSERSAEIAAKTPDFGFYGWATENGGTTGGAGGTEVVVNNLADFKLYANAPGAYIIYIYGTISGNEMVRVGSNKSILGVGSNARFLGVGLTIGWSTAVPKISNVIVRNITFEKIRYPNDAITVGYSTKNVWIDHCDFFSDRLHGVDGYDGLVDVNHGSDFITVSWNRFYEHYKTSLVGNSEDTGAEDFGHLTVTYHHNSFINSGGRNPSVRFGTVHIFNNHYRDLDDYAIASRQSAQVVIENNWLENVTRPIRADTSLSPVAGYVRGVESNTFINCGANSITLGPATWVPPYAYTLDPVTNLPTYTGWWAGVGIVTWNAASPPNPLTLTSGGGGTVAADPTPGPYTPGTVVTLTATPDVDYYFTNWSGDLTGSTNPTTITMDTPKSVTAHFAPIVTGLSLTVTTVGSGSVTRIPDLSSYVSGTVVTLTAAPVVGGSFVGWGGDCSGTALTCELTMDVAKSVTATFTVVASAAYLHDVFADGERVTQTLPDSAKWMTSSGTGNLSVVSNELTQAVSSSRTLLAYFTDDQGAPVTLSAGQLLKLDFTFRHSGFDNTAPAATFTFRAALLRSVANPAAVAGTGFTPTGPPNTNARVTGDFGSNNPTSNAFSLYTGYAAFAAVNATGTATPIRLYARNGSSPNILNSTSSPPFTEVTGGTPTASIPMAVATPYRGTLTLLHTGSSIVLSFVITRVSDGAVMMSRTVTDAGATMTSFDTAAFYATFTSGATAYNLIFSDVQVSRSATFDLTAATAGTGSGSVTSSPAGIDCGVDCSETYEQGTVVTLTATPVAGSAFTGWSGDCSGSSLTCNVTMDGARSVTAGFAPAFTLTVATAGTGAGTITATGIDCGLDCTEPYADGSVVTLTAAPAGGSVFTGWSGDCTGPTLTCDVTMDAARSVTATFSVAYTLTVARDGAGTGTVTAAGIDCGTDCSEDYAAGSIVTLTATSDPGSTFAAWSGDCAGVTVTCDVTMAAARSVTATFALQPSTIFLHDTWADANRTNQGLPDSAAWFASSGSSSITTTVGEMNQSVSSARTLLAYFTNDQGTPVTLGTGQVLRLDFTFRLTNFDTAAAATASTFRVGLLRSVANPAAVTGTGFVPTTPPPNTNARVTGDYGSGSPSSNVFSIYTGYAALTSANAVGTAIPVKFYARNLSDPALIASTNAYTKFSDGTTTPSVPMAADTAYHGTLSLVRTDSGIAMTYVLVQVSDGAVVMSHSVTDPAASMTAFDTAAFYVSKAGSSANYNLIFTDVQVSRATAHILTAATAGTGSGTVTASGINCGVDCSEGYEQGAVVTLTATPATGSTFTGWRGDCSGTTPSCDVTMNGARSATATFVLNTYALTLATDGTGTGSVASSPTGIDCGLDCTETYDYGTVVLLTATPAAGSVLLGWSGDCDGTVNPFGITIDAAKSCTATFVPATVVIGTRTKAVSGSFYSNGSIVYTIILSNTGTATQADNAGDELVDTLPSNLTLVSANATSGTAATDVPGNSVTWNGSIPSGDSVTMTINATVGAAVALDTTISNQATISYDANADGTNDATALTDDPSVVGTDDPTDFVVVSASTDFFSVAPCRLLDTRNAVGTYGGPALAAGGDRVYPLFNQCGIPPTARAVSVNLTVTGPTTAGNLRLYPAGATLPTTSSINYVGGLTRGNNAVIPLNGLGELAVYCTQASGTVHFILDVNGYFE